MRNFYKRLCSVLNNVGYVSCMNRRESYVVLCVYPFRMSFLSNPKSEMSNSTKFVCEWSAVATSVLPDGTSL